MSKMGGKKGGKSRKNQQHDDNDNSDGDIPMKTGSPVKINYEAYNEQFGEYSSGK